MRTVGTILQNAVNTTTSTDFSIDGAKRVTLELTRTDHTSGNTAYTFFASVDGTNFHAYNKVITNTANTNAQNLIRVASVTLSSATTNLVSLDLQHDVFKAFRVTATRTTDGKSTVRALISYED